MVIFKLLFWGVGGGSRRGTKEARRGTKGYANMKRRIRAASMPIIPPMTEATASIKS